MAHHKGPNEHGRALRAHGLQTADKQPPVQPRVRALWGGDHDARHGLAGWLVRFVDHHVVVDGQHGPVQGLHLVQGMQLFDAVRPKQLPVRAAGPNDATERFMTRPASEVSAGNGHDESLAVARRAQGFARFYANQRRPDRAALGREDGLRFGECAPAVLVV